MKRTTDNRRRRRTKASPDSKQTGILTRQGAIHGFEPNFDAFEKLKPVQVCGRVIVAMRYGDANFES